MLAHRTLGEGGRQAAAEDVSSKDGMVVCTSAPACDAGAAVLAKGGNAVDAAVATAFALAVTLPSAGNIGGGGFMVVRSPNGAVTTFDYREKAPLKATRDDVHARRQSRRLADQLGISRARACPAACAASRSRTSGSGGCRGKTS